METWTIALLGLLVLGILFYIFGSNTIGMLRNYYLIIGIIGGVVIFYQFFLKDTSETKVKQKLDNPIKPRVTY